MWILVLALLLVAAQVNASWLVPLKAGDPEPPLWVGGRFLWPYSEQTRVLVGTGGMGGLLTLVLAMGAATCFLLAAAALLKWWVPATWLPALVVTGAAMSLLLQALSPSVWSLFPAIVCIGLLGMALTGVLDVSVLR